MRFRQSNEDPRNRIDAYLDGQLDGADRSVFEFQLAVDPELRDEVDSQRHVDESLKHLFAAPSEDMIGRVRSLAESSLFDDESDRRRLPAWVGYAMAASIILALLIGGRAAIWYKVDRPNDRLVQVISTNTNMTLEQAYEDEIRHGFEPLWECDNGVELAVNFHRRLGQGVSLRKPVDEIKVVGLSMNNCISPWTTCLMAKVFDEEVIVFVDHVSRAGQFDYKPRKGMNLFRRQVGDLVFFELTPWNGPAMLELVQHIEVPVSWLGEFDYR